LLIWFWSTPVASISQQLVQPFGNAIMIDTSILLSYTINSVVHLDKCAGLIRLPHKSLSSVHLFSFFLGFCSHEYLADTWHDSPPLMLKEENNVFQWCNIILKIAFNAERRKQCICVCMLNLLFALLQGDYYLGRLEEFKITILW